VKLLPDAHTFLLLAAAPEQVSPIAMAHLRSKENGILISAAMEWQLVEWVREGRVELPCDVPTLVERELHAMQAHTLALTHEHLATYARLVPHHGNHYERLLVSQAMHEGYVIVSGDPVFKEYPVTVLW
jgi:PIN domain nuclease of toxin-antitoxin system